AAERLAEWRPAPEARADVWFFDGFAPARNPEMWSTEILRAAFERAKPGGAFATYSAAGWVRRNLAAAGFEAARAPGYGAKRHMTRGRRP
ncbi:MAG: MnmC family methyltransferase, partial [Pseudomonadota bacterium]